jgi:hypothetical protein
MSRRAVRTTLSSHRDPKEPTMFTTSTLHTDFARQLQQDRRAEVRIRRGRSAPGRVRVLLAALRPAGFGPVPAGDAERRATA